jgi:hypothetical protein
MKKFYLTWNEFQATLGVNCFHHELIPHIQTGFLVPSHLSESVQIPSSILQILPESAQIDF